MALKKILGLRYLVKRAPELDNKMEILNVQCLPVIANMGQGH